MVSVCVFHEIAMTASAKFWPSRFKELHRLTFIRAKHRTTIHTAQ